MISEKYMGTLGPKGSYSEQASFEYNKNEGPFIGSRFT